MKIVEVENGSEIAKAALFNKLPMEKELTLLVNILIGRDEVSQQLLKPVFPGSVPDTMGAKQTLFLALKEVPEGGFGKGGIYGIMNWVSNILDNAMPEGWGAAITQPMLFSLELIKDDEKEEWVDVVVISPMNRSETKLTGMYVADPHVDGPSLYPVGK